jgi:hypothetical protein
MYLSWFNEVKLSCISNGILISTEINQANPPMIERYKSINSRLHQYYQPKNRDEFHISEDFLKKDDHYILFLIFVVFY